MFPTKNDLPEAVRKKIISLLQDRLSSGIDLMQNAKQAHWNVKGPNFSELHKLFDKVHEQIEESNDLLAERIAQLGGIAEGTCKIVANMSSLPEYPVTAVLEEVHIAALSDSLSAFAKLIREAIADSDELEDLNTADIFTQISRIVDKNLWLVESHGIHQQHSPKASRTSRERAAQSQPRSQ